jgi:hypothetical protein
MVTHQRKDLKTYTHPSCSDSPFCAAKTCVGKRSSTMFSVYIENSCCCVGRLTTEDINP